MRAVVQFIPNGTRFKLLIPKENCLISFALVGMRCPMCARRDTGQAAEPYGDEALAFSRGLFITGLLLDADHDRCARIRINCNQVVRKRSRALMPVA